MPIILSRLLPGIARPSVAALQKVVAPCLLAIAALALSACNSGPQVAANTTPTAPQITVQPEDQGAIAGDPATFSVVATGTAPLAYQWSRDGAEISGATAASYTTPPTTTADTGATFSVVVTNSQGSATSTAATLTVSDAAVAPAITSQPAGQSVTAGSAATFTVVATGTAPLSYQWSKNGTAIGGATGASYTTPATVVSDSGAVFTVVIANSVGSTSSTAAMLTVTAASVAPTITTQPANQSVAVGAKATFSVVAGGTAPAALPMVEERHGHQRRDRVQLHHPGHGNRGRRRGLHRRRDEFGGQCRQHGGHVDGRGGRAEHYHAAARPERRRRRNRDILGGCRGHAAAQLSVVEKWRRHQRRHRRELHDAPPPPSRTAARVSRWSLAIRAAARPAMRRC